MCEGASLVGMDKNLLLPPARPPKTRVILKGTERGKVCVLCVWKMPHKLTWLQGDTQT